MRALASDLQTLPNAARHAGTTAFETARPEAIEALDHDEAWGDLVKASAGHGLRAFSARKDHAAFMTAYATAAD